MASIYEANGFTYTVDENGTITAEGNVPSQGVHCGTRVTPEGMVEGDQRGHVIAASHGGVNETYNMTAQNANVNQRGYKAAERAETELARQGYTVNTSKTAYVSNQQGGRPDAYMINDTIVDPSGKTHTVNLSFANMSYEDQEAINAELANMDFPDEYANPDPLRESMSKEEYTNLMEETDKEMTSVKDEYDFTNTTEVNFSDEQSNSFDGTSVDCGQSASAVDGVGQTSDDGTMDGGTDSGTDGGTDGGMDGGM